jgi:LPXTG-site transpeptidase (sortase) family protein
MSHSSPALDFGRPILSPPTFKPKRVWTDKDYIYRYDPERQICKRSPINPQVFTGSMFFLVGRTNLFDRSQPTLTTDAGGPTAAPLLRSPFPLAARLFMSALWAIGIVAAIVFIYPLWPSVAYEVQQLNPNSLTATADESNVAPSSAPPVTNVLQSQGAVPTTQPNQVIVPKIGVDTPIVEGPSLKVLNKTEGVWHQTGSVNHGNFVLAGHRFRYMPPNTSTLYELNQLQVGDIIKLDWMGKQITYHVIQMKVVPASDVEILNQTKSPRLTLYSCNDVLMTHRVVAIAIPYT